MNNKSFTDIAIPDRIDSVIEKGVQKAVREKKSRKIRFRMASAAAGFVLVCLLGAANPALATKLPILGSVFGLIEKSITFGGNYSQYATGINETAYSNGVRITLSDILCDGQSLYVTYKVESSKPFLYTSWGEAPLDRKQLLTTEEYNKVDFTNKQLSNSGFAGLEGKFLDEKTFVGMEKYNLSMLGEEVPDKFDFMVELTSVGTSAIQHGDRDHIIRGAWAFKVPVTVDPSLKRTKEVLNVESKGHKVESIAITPFELAVKTSHPVEDTLTSIVRVYDENNNELPFNLSHREDTNQTGLYKAPPKDSSHIRIVIFKDILEEVSRTDSKGGKEITYRDVGDEILLDEIIFIGKN